MLDLLAFDLDGTLANTEQLKAESYAWAAHRLRPDVAETDVEAAYPAYVGRSREEIATALLHQFGLGEAARAHNASVEPWESFVTVRLGCYRSMLADGDLVRRHARPHAIALVRRAHEVARAVALVTTSDRPNTEAVLAALGLSGAFDTTVTADDVANTKPDPEGYRLALDRLGAEADRTLAVEDSPAGLRAALAAGLHVIACPTDYTRDRVEAMARAGELETVMPDDLAEAVRQATLTLDPAR